MESTILGCVLRGAGRRGIPSACSRPVFASWFMPPADRAAISGRRCRGAPGPRRFPYGGELSPARVRRLRFRCPPIVARHFAPNVHHVGARHGNWGPSGRHPPAGPGRRDVSHRRNPVALSINHLGRHPIAMPPRRQGKGRPSRANPPSHRIELAYRPSPMRGIRPIPHIRHRPRTQWLRARGARRATEFPV